MITAFSLVAYPKGTSAFFERDKKRTSYHRIGTKSLARIQRLAYRLFEENKAIVYPGPRGEYVRWTVEMNKEKS